MATLTTSQLAQLSTDYQSLAQQLLQYKLDNAASLNILDFQDLGSRINVIIHNSNLLAALATYQIAQDITAQLGSINESTKAINDALKTITSVQSVIDIATTIVNLGTSLISFNVGGIVNNVSDLINQIKAA